MKGSPTAQKCAVAALLALGALAAVVMVTSDSESVVREDSAHEATRQIPVDASLLAEAQGDAVDDGETMESDASEGKPQWSSIDDAGAWAKAAEEAASFSDDAVKLKQQNKKREQADNRKRKVKDTMAKVDAE